MYLLIYQVMLNLPLKIGGLKTLLTVLATNGRNVNRKLSRVPISYTNFNYIFTFNVLRVF